MIRFLIDITTSKRPTPSHIAYATILCRGAPFPSGFHLSRLWLDMRYRLISIRLPLASRSLPHHLPTSFPITLMITPIMPIPIPLIMRMLPPLSPPIPAHSRFAIAASPAVSIANAVTGVAVRGGGIGRGFADGAGGVVDATD